MKKDWVAVGVIELVAGTLAVLVSYAALRTSAFGSMIGGWGFIFVIIGAIVLTHGLRAKNQKEGYCLSCGRSVEFGRMYCRKCNPK